jgi:ABC-type transport system involved in multi-copper enzyme maturation permease subunit
MPSLLWKEWHEQSWKLGFGCIVLGALALIGLHARIVADETMIKWVCFLGVTMLPVLSSTGLVPAERGEGTLESLLALPVKPWKILAAKTLIGLILCAGPLAVAMGVSLLIAGGREMPSSAILGVYSGCIGVAVSLFIWMLALTIQLPSEARAALIGVGLLIFWMLATAGLGAESMPKWAMSISPFAMIYEFANRLTYDINGNGPLPPSGVLAVQMAIAAALWLWALSRLTDLEGQS